MLNSIACRLTSASVTVRLNVPWTVHHDINFEAIMLVIASKSLYDFNTSIQFDSSAAYTVYFTDKN